MVSDTGDADRPLSSVLAGQSGQRQTLAPAVQTSLLPRSTESGARRPNARRGGTQLDSAYNPFL